MICLTEVVVRAMARLQGGSGNLEQVFAAVCVIEPDLGKSLMAHDLVTAVQEAKAAGLVTVKYDPKNRVDIIGLRQEGDGK